MKTRLESVSVLQERYTLLESKQVKAINRGIRSHFLEKGNLKSSLQSRSTRLDICDAHPDEVRRILLSFGIPLDERVLVVWCSIETGISIVFREFVQYYDDLWYPSSDDVWVTQGSLPWLIEFHHEEIITFVASSTETAI